MARRNKNERVALNKRKMFMDIKQNCVCVYLIFLCVSDWLSGWLAGYLLLPWSANSKPKRKLNANNCNYSLHFSINTFHSFMSADVERVARMLRAFFIFSSLYFRVSIFELVFFWNDGFSLSLDFHWFIVAWNW